MSSALQVHYGAPQGSVLGPILFNIYVKNLSEEIKDCFLVQYADATQYLQTGTIDSLLQLIHDTEQTLTKTKHYFNKNGLLLNSMKAQCIFIGSRAFISKFWQHNYQCCGGRYSSQQECKNLGLLFDNCTSYDVHVTEMSTIVFSTLYINRIQDLLIKEARLKAVETLALSHISDGVAAWSTANITQLKRVKKLCCQSGHWRSLQILPCYSASHQTAMAPHPTDGHLRAMHNIFQNNEHSAP